jgi:hypothetical protein
VLIQAECCNQAQSAAEIKKYTEICSLSIRVEAIMQTKAITPVIRKSKLCS